MKYFFGIHKKEEDNVFNNYLIRTVSEETEEQTQEDIDEHNEIVKKKAFPDWLLTLSFVILAIGLITVIRCVFSGGEFNNRVLVILIIGIGLVALGGITMLIGSLMNKHLTEKDEDFKRNNEKLEERINIHRNELNIPQDTKNIDVLFSFVKEKNGQEKINIWKLYNHYNQELTVFLEDGMLCFCDNHSVFGVPIESFKRIVPMKRRQIIAVWNKEESFNSDKYKEYKIRNTNQGLSCKCYAVILVLNNEEYQIIIPNYDLEEFRKILSLTVVEEE